MVSKKLSIYYTYLFILFYSINTLLHPSLPEKGEKALLFPPFGREALFRRKEAFRSLPLVAELFNGKGRGKVKYYIE
jgi:hypothetical protein